MRRFTSLACALTLIASAAHAQSDNPPSRVARISALVGQASIQPSGSDEWGDATLNYTITTGDRIYTSPGSRLELEIGPLVVRLSENADVTVTNLDDDLLQLAVAQGTIRLSVYRVLNSDSIEVDTPNGAAIISAPGRYRIDVPPDGRYSGVSIETGAVVVVGPGIEREFRAVQAVQLSGTDRIHVFNVGRPARTIFDQWSDDRDGRVNASQCSRYMSNDIPGCADLDESGQWEANVEFGIVWYPTRVRVDWVPYCDGRWVWIAPWGWTWVAEEPWGYAPFHYGRWAHIGRRWGWIPGPIMMRPYYAPALVVFVGGPGWRVGVNIGAQAWFPLGPREAYHPWYHHDDRYLRSVNMTNVRNVTNINVFIAEPRGGPVRYVNQTAGIIAVSGDGFRNGRPVGKERVTVRPEDVERASIIPHPTVVPVERSAIGGRPVAKPPVAPRPIMRPTMRPPTAPPTTGTRGAPPGRGAPPSRVEPPTRGAPPARGVPPTRGNPPGRGRGDDVQQTGKIIITRVPPPLEKPPFRDQEKALQTRPGRPLEPQQMQNVRDGKAAGPAKDPVTPPQKIAPAKEPPRGGKSEPPGRGRGGRDGS